MDLPEFKPWPKMPRFFGTKIIVSEKIDGTNGVIYIHDVSPENEEHSGFHVCLKDKHYAVFAGSRTRWLDTSSAVEKYGKEFNNPEGFVIFHDRAQQVFKVPINK